MSTSTRLFYNDKVGHYHRDKVSYKFLIHCSKGKERAFEKFETFKNRFFDCKCLYSYVHYWRVLLCG